MNQAIEAINLAKSYNGHVAVDGVNFSVEAGSVFGLLGPNGAGKTTTIRILTGLISPTSGKAVILGYDVASEALQAKARIGVVPEASNIYEEMTARDNLIFSAELYGVPKAERRRRADELLEEYRLADRAGDIVQGFSRGMKRRLTIACALIHHPDLLFLDEPTTGLDIQSARQLRDQVRRLNKGGVTVLLTTHYLEEADQLCDTIAMINRGKIVTIDSPENLKACVTGDNVVEVSFGAPVQEDELASLGRVTEVHRLGDKYRLTYSGGDPVGGLVDYARGHGVNIVSINTLRPSLEDAFLKLTGLNPEEVHKEKEPQKQRRGDG
jgi:ABC-2 type transport system ATP-binding protein